MKIGVLCYPTHGGSGVVASELAIGLAERGHEVHIVSYATPFRLQSFHPNLFMHEVGFATYPLFKYPPYALGLATKLVDLAESYQIELIHAHYAIPHAASAYLAKQILNSKELKTVTTLHGTDITLVGADASFQKVIKFAIEEARMVSPLSRSISSNGRSKNSASSRISGSSTISSMPPGRNKTATPVRARPLRPTARRSSCMLRTSARSKERTMSFACSRGFKSLSRRDSS